jgi:hypothetical protein
MKARPAVIVASVIVLIGVWVVVLLHALPTTDDLLRLPSSGAPPAATSPAPPDAAPTPGPLQAGPAGGQPGTPAAGASSSGPDQEDLSENDVEDEPQPGSGTGGSGGGLTGLTAGLAIVTSPLGHPILPSPPALPVP